MKIAMLIDGWDPPIFGGGQMHVKYLCEGLVNNHDCSVDLFVRKLVGEDGKKYIKNEYHGKWNVYRIGPTTKFFTIWGRLLCLCTTTLYLLWNTIIKKYDIIHAHAYVSGLPAKIVGFLTKTPVVYTVHGTNCLDTDRKGFLYKFEKFLVTGIKYTLEISVSHRIFDYKNKNKNIIILHNGVDIHTYDTIHVNKTYSGYNFLFVGRFDWQKGIEYLIEAVHLIDKKLLDKKNVQFNLVGDGIFINVYKMLIKKYSLEKYFIFKGKLFGDNLVREYKSNQCFVLPSLAEGQPLTLLEAMASKLPVIVTDVGDNKYFVKNKENGYIVPSADALVLSKSIVDILHMNSLDVNRIIQTNYTIAQKYSRDNVVKDTYNQYISLMK